jgi:hypothetical protein
MNGGAPLSVSSTSSSSSGGGSSIYGDGGSRTSTEDDCSHPGANLFYSYSKATQSYAIADPVKKRKSNPQKRRITPTFLAPLSQKSRFLFLVAFEAGMNK